MGKYLYNSKITHFSSINAYNITVDSLIIHNFADTMDLAFGFNYSNDKNDFNFGFHDSITDYHNKTWHVTSNFDDPSTSLLENNIQNGTMTLYFKMTNIKYYINQNVAYYYCDCKHVYVKN